MAYLLRSPLSHSACAFEAASTSARCLPAVHRVHARRPIQTRRSPAVPAVAASSADANGSAAAVEQLSKTSLQSVGDIMTQAPIHCVKPDDTVDDALHILVKHKVTGLPVVDDKKHVVGIVSDYDLLALDTLGRTNDGELFPLADQTWQAFKEVRVMLAKAGGKKIRDVMTKAPLVVRPETCLEDATSILLSKGIGRLPVVNANGELVGILSRGNIVRAALAQRILEVPRCDLP